MNANMIQTLFPTWSSKAGRDASRRGFTLTELLVSMAIISVLATVSAAIFRTTLNTRDLTEQKIEVSEVGRALIDLIADELRTAYLSPESLSPVLEGSLEAQGQAYRMRFAGIRNDTEYSTVISPSSSQSAPGFGIDDDGDGTIDEEMLNDVDDDGDGLVDEDFGTFPDDLLHFVRLLDSAQTGGELAVEEISYGLNQRGTRLIRRAKRFSADSTVAPLSNAGSFYETTGNLGSLVPALVPTANALGEPVLQTGDLQVRSLVQWDQITQDDQFSKYTSLATLAYDIRGLRFSYWYYDYTLGGYRRAKEWDSARETSFLVVPLQPSTATAQASRLLFRHTAWHSGFFDPTDPNFGRDLVANISNEPDDAFPRVQAFNKVDYMFRSPAQLFAQIANPEASQLARRIGAHTDGLPVFVEITIYVQDRSHVAPPVPFTARVFLPNNNLGART